MNPLKTLHFSLLFSLFSLLFSLPASAFYADVPTDQQYYTEIQSLYDQKLLPETPNFEPDKTLTKADFYQLLLTFGHAEIATKIDLPFVDITNDNPQAPYLQTAIDLQILPAFQGQTLGAEFPIKKYIALETMFQTLGIGQKPFFDQTKFPFRDITPKSFTAKTAYRAAELHIVDEHAPENFAPFANITKAEAAYYLYQISQYNQGKQDQPITIQTNEKKTESDHPIFDNVWDSIQNDYLHKNDLDKKTLEYNAVQGLLETVNDPYSVFEAPEEAKNFLQNFGGKLEGVGITIEKINDQIVIISPLKNSPAEKAGLKAKDLIIEIDGQTTKDQNLSTIASKIKGPTGTKVKLKILRNNTELNFEIERNFILIETVESEMTEGYAHITIKNFSRSTYKEFLTNLDKIATNKPKGYIIDLRNNPGGYLDIAVDLIGLFSKDKITAVKLQNAKNNIETFTTSGDGRLAGTKVTVLVNAGSASASEIFAGALQDYGFATIIGQTTFGKGVAQSITQYTDQSLLRLTTAKWLTPNDREIQSLGITPNTLTKENEELKAAVKELAK